MKKITFMVFLLGLSTGMIGQENNDKKACVASREFARREMMDLEIDNRSNQVSLNFQFGPKSANRFDYEKYRFSVIVQLDNLFTKHRRTLFSYGSNSGAWEMEYTQSIVNAEHHFYYEATLRNPDVTTLAEFKTALKKLLFCRYDTVKIILEGDNFIEYIADGKQFHHSFVVGQGFFNMEGAEERMGSIEMIGYSPLTHYSKLRKSYISTFELNTPLLEQFIIDKGFKPLK